MHTDSTWGAGMVELAAGVPTNLRSSVKPCSCKSYSVLVCLGFMAYQPLKVIQCYIHFYTNKQLHFKQLSLACVHGSIVKNVSISSYSV